MYKTPNPKWLMQEQGSKRKELAFVFSIVSLPFDDLYRLGILHSSQLHGQFPFIVKSVCLSPVFANLGSVIIICLLTALLQYYENYSFQNSVVFPDVLCTSLAVMVIVEV